MHSHPIIPGAITPLTSSSRLTVFFAAVALFLGSRYFTQFGLHSFIWMLVYLGFVATFALRFGEMLQVMRDNLVFLTYPALCLTSVLWSQAPENSLRFGLQVTVSIMIAIYIGHRLGLQKLLYVLLAVSGIGIALSIINLSGIFFFPFDRNGLFTGVFQSKNALGEGTTHFSLAATGLLMFTPHVATAVKLLLIAGLLSTLALLVIAKTASGLILTISGALIIVAVGLLYRGPLSRAFVLGTSALLISVALFSLTALSINPWAELLRALGKDTTLTGRTDLWEQGLQVFAAHPFLGIGVDAFWASPSYQNFVLAFQSFHGAGVLSFHNLIVELLVAFGVLGILVHLGIFLAIVRRASSLFRTTVAPLALWALVVCVIYYVQSMVGTTLVKPHEGNFMMLIALGAALAREMSEQRNLTSPAEAVQ